MRYVPLSHFSLLVQCEPYNLYNTVFLCSGSCGLPATARDQCPDFHRCGLNQLPVISSGIPWTTSNFTLPLCRVLRHRCCLYFHWSECQRSLWLSLGSFLCSSCGTLCLWVLVFSCNCRKELESLLQRVGVLVEEGIWSGCSEQPSEDKIYCIITSDYKRLCNPLLSSASVCWACPVAAGLDLGRKAYVLQCTREHSKTNWGLWPADQVSLQKNVWKEQFS